MICSTCHLAETIGNETRCRPCQAAYMRTYRLTAQTLALRRSYQSGRKSFREDAMAALRTLDDEVTTVEIVTALLIRVDA